MRWYLHAVIVFCWTSQEPRDFKLVSKVDSVFQSPVGIVPSQPTIVPSVIASGQVAGSVSLTTRSSSPSSSLTIQTPLSVIPIRHSYVCPSDWPLGLQTPKQPASITIPSSSLQVTRKDSQLTGNVIVKPSTINPSSATSSIDPKFKSRASLLSFYLGHMVLCSVLDYALESTGVFCCFCKIFVIFLLNVRGLLWSKITATPMQL